MKIVVTGNIGSGKTTVLKEINKHINFEEIVIDDYRVRYSDGSLEGEFKARENFFCDVQVNKSQLIECTGVGEVARCLSEKLKKFKEPIILVVLLTAKKICLERIENRIWDIPFPYKKEPIHKKLTRIERALYNDTIWRDSFPANNITIILRKHETPQDTVSIVEDTIQLIE